MDQNIRNRKSDLKTIDELRVKVGLLENKLKLNHDGYRLAIARINYLNRIHDNDKLQLMAGKWMMDHDNEVKSLVLMSQLYKLGNKRDDHKIDEVMLNRILKSRMLLNKHTINKF